MSEAHRRALAHFNHEEYREALLAWEEIWHEDRSDDLVALLRLCVALNQLRFGLYNGPQRMLQTAEELLAPYAPHTRGLDVTQILNYIRTLRELIPPDGPAPDWEQVPRLQLEI